MALTEGKHKVKACDYSILKTKNGEPQIIIRFEDDQEEGANWTGYVHTKGSLDITLKTLKLLDCKTPDFEAFADGPTDDPIIDFEKYVEVDVVKEEYTTPSGDIKSFTKVNFVNPIGFFGEPMSKEEAKKKFAQYNVKAEWLAKFGNTEDKAKEEMDNIPF